METKKNINIGLTGTGAMLPDKSPKQEFLRCCPSSSTCPSCDVERLIWSSVGCWAATTGSKLKISSGSEHWVTILKCLFAENKPKKELIQVLIQRGYESDPVKAWKEAQNKVMPQSSSEYAQTGPELWGFIILREAQVAFQFAGFKSFCVCSVALPLCVRVFVDCVCFKSTCRMKRRGRKKRMTKNQLQPLVQTSTTCWTCPCGIWPRRRKMSSASRGITKYVPSFPYTSIIFYILCII